MKLAHSTKPGLRETRGLTIVEAVVAMAIAGVAIAAMTGGFYSLFRSTEAASYSLSANALAVQTYEQMKAAKWDALSYPPEDEVVSSNFPPRGYVMDMVRAGNSYVYATNYTTITTVSTNPLIKAIRIDCVYRLDRSGLVTNTLVSYRGAMTGQQNTLENPAPATPTLPPAGGTITETNGRSGAFPASNTWVTTGGRSGYGRSGGSSGGRRTGGSRDDDDD